ncbi:MAG: flagellar export chaperone FliS [Kofleriaceae bacterium]
MYARAANAYRRVDLESAPRSQIVDRLFERFDRDVATARDAITRRDISAKASAIDHALQIVFELAASLDHNAAPELCGQLASLYEFVTNQLAVASAKLSCEPIDHARRVMAELADAFKQVHPR